MSGESDDFDSIESATSVEEELKSSQKSLSTSQNKPKAIALSTSQSSSTNTNAGPKSGAPSLFSPRPIADEAASTNNSLFSPRASLTNLADKETSKERRNSVRLQLHNARAQRTVRNIALIVIGALCLIALPTSIAAFVLIAQYEPTAAPFCPNTPLGTWAAIVAVFNIVALLCFIPWLIQPSRIKRYVVVVFLWLVGATQIGLIIWGAVIWVAASPPATCVNAYGGNSTGLGVMATILFAFTIAIWLTVCLALLGNNINSKLRAAEIELGVTAAPQTNGGESDRQKWERERDEEKQRKAAKKRAAAPAAAAKSPAAGAGAAKAAAKADKEESSSGSSEQEGESRETSSESESKSDSTDDESTEESTEEEESSSSKGSSSSDTTQSTSSSSSASSSASSESTKESTEQTTQTETSDSSSSED